MPGNAGSEVSGREKAFPGASGTGRPGGSPQGRVHGGPGNDFSRPPALQLTLRRADAIAWLLLALLWFGLLDTPHLFNPDEGRYAEIPREMVASGNWITPRLDGLKYFEKPPLQYWATAAAYHIAGQHAWTVRLWPALCAFLGLLLSAGVARRLYGPRAAAFTVIVQASSLLYIGMARVATLDMCLTFTLQLAMSALVLLAHQRDARAGPAVAAGQGPRWGLPALLAVGVALAVLAKGLVGILIPGAVAVIYLALYRDWRLLLRAQPWWTLLALLVIAGPWFLLVSLRNPEFPRFFFIYEHFQRYLNRAGFDRYQPAWFFLPILVAGVFPWTTLLPRALGESLRAARREPASGLLLIWAAFVLAFFSASQSKLVPYILPMFPALSLLLGRTLAQLPARRFAAHLTAVAVFAALIAVAVLVIWALPGAAALTARASTASLVALVLAFVVLALAAALAAHGCRQGRALLGAACTALGTLLFAQALLAGVARLPRMRAETLLVQALSPWIDQYRHFYCVGDYVQSVPFYLRRTCTLVGYRGELDFGLTQQPSLGIDTPEELVPVWKREQSAVAIVRASLFGQLQALGMPMHVIYSSPSYVVVVRQ